MSEAFETIISKRTEKMITQIMLIIVFLLIVILFFYTCCIHVTLRGESIGMG